MALRAVLLIDTLWFWHDQGNILPSLLIIETISYGDEDLPNHWKILQRWYTDGRNMELM